jgi:hypothetical protein
MSGHGLLDETAFALAVLSSADRMGRAFTSLMLDAAFMAVLLTCVNASIAVNYFESLTEPDAIKPSNPASSRKLYSIRAER